MADTSTRGAAADLSEPDTVRRDRGVRRFRDTLLAHEVGFVLARARVLGNSLANRLLTDVDLKVRHFAALSMACSGKRPSQRELGVFLDLDPSQVVALVDHLESRGLIQREIDTRDRRSKVMVATEAGHALHQRATQLTRRAEDELLKNLSDTERDQLLALLTKIVF